MLSTVTNPHPSEEERAFLQRRVGAFGLTAGLFFGFFLTFRFAIAGPVVLGDASFHWHAIAALCFGSVWVICRSGAHSVRLTRVVETVGLLAGAASTSIMATEIELAARPEYIQVMALTGGFFARAIYVPSSGRHTLVLGVLAGVPILATTYGMYIEMDVAKWTTVSPELLDRTPTEVATMMTLWTAAWWVNTVAIGTAASKVIFGLRREVSDVRQLGQYRLEEKIGEGAMGAVFRANHAMLRRPTAIKLLLPERTGERELARFEREVRLTAQLVHPNTVTIFDYGRTLDGVFYYAMELIDGATLSEIVEISGPQPVERVVQILMQASSALVEAHGIGLVHRDIKPANVMLCMPHQHGGVAETVKVVDFGLAREVTTGGDAGLTRADVITGTPLYMSPEAIARPDDVDGRSDLYALGAVGYYLLTGAHLFDAKTPVEVCAMHLATPPPPLSERTDRSIPADLESLIMTCLAKDRSDRPPSALSMHKALVAIGLAAEWDAHESEEWWGEYGAAIRSEHVARGAAGSKTMDIAIVRRGAS